MFWCSMFISERPLKWMSCPSKKIIWSLIGEVPHTSENWVMDLIHPSISIYPYGVWWNIQYSGMFKWRSWEYFFLVQNNGHHEAFPIVIHTRMVLAPQFSPSTLVHLKITCNYRWPCPTPIGVKPNFITVPHLSGSWLNVIEARRDIHVLQ